MRRKFNNNSKNNFYDQGKVLYNVPDFNRQPSTPSSFPTKPAEVKGRYETPFNKTRSYDSTLNKVDINITGSAPIFGSTNSRKTYNLGTSLGLYTGSLNNTFYQNDFNQIATMQRDYSINYWGMNLATNPQSSTEIQNKEEDKSIITWIENCAMMETKIRAAMYTDLNIFNWKFQTQPSGSKLPKYDEIFQTPLPYQLITYQHDVITVLITVLRFESLISQLPKLQELFRNKVDFFIFIQNELKRSKYGSIIKSLMSWLKQRYIDKHFFSNYIAPLLVVSKQTDGIDSSLNYIKPHLYTPLQPIEQINAVSKESLVNTQRIPVYIGASSITTTKNADGKITSIQSDGQDIYILDRNLNAFDLDTLLSYILENQTLDDFKNDVNKWLNDAFTTLTIISGEALDMIRTQNIIDLESMLAKMATNPGGITWEQNTNFTAIPPVMKFEDWALVNDLITFTCSEPINNPNGFTMLVPMYRKTGIPAQLLYSDIQFFTQPSAANYISFYSRGNTITMRTRRNNKFQINISQQDYIYQSTRYSIPKLTVTRGDGTPSAMEDTEAYLLMQDNFPNLTYTNGEIINSDFLTYVVASYENLVANAIMEARRHFIIAQA